MFTPIDIQNHNLKISVRGYNKKDTDDFLEQVLTNYEKLYKENQELNDKINALNEQVQYYKNMEDTLQKALVLAEKTSSETKEAAKDKADAMVNEAQIKAEAMLNEATTKSESMINEAQTRADAIQKEANAYAEVAKADANHQLETSRAHVRKLTQSYESYRLQFKKLAESQIEMLESDNYSIFAPDISDLMDEKGSEVFHIEGDMNFISKLGDEMFVETGRKTEVENSEEADTVYFAKEKEMADSAVEEMIKEKAEQETVTKTDDERLSEEAKGDVTEAESDRDFLSPEKEREVPEVEDEQEKTVENALDEGKEILDETSEEPDLETKNPANESVERTYASLDMENTKDLGNGDKAWRETTPKIEGFEHMEISNSVEPQEEKEEDSPFTFIDTE